jgi:hypothetical protein
MLKILMKRMFNLLPIEYRKSQKENKARMMISIKYLRIASIFSHR